MVTRPAGEPPDSGDERLLRDFERRMAADGDPLEALADVLGGGGERRRELFHRFGEDVLGCRLEYILGAGGMGVTYAARTLDGERVAIKLVTGVGDLAGRRFDLECSLLRKLDHPAIVRYRDHAVLGDGTGVLCMDLVNGVDLEVLLARLDAARPSGVAASLLVGVDVEPSQRLRSARVRRRLLRLLAAIADGLHAAHQHGVVHRDVKPANILVREDLSPVLIDFGLARDHLARVSFTGSGAAIGTLGYMAPEQFDGEQAVDARTDVYALGQVLLRVLLGDLVEADIGAVVRARHRPFLLDGRQSRVLPIELQAVLYRCLDPRPSHRYGTAHELAEDLRAAAGAGDVQARRPGALRRFARDRVRLSWSVAMLLLGVGLLAYLLVPRGHMVVVSSNCGQGEARVLLPDGREALLGEPFWLALGTHRLTLSGPDVVDIDKQVHVEERGDSQRVVMLTQHLAGVVPRFAAEGRALAHFMSGHSLLPMAANVRIDHRFVDGVRIEDPWVHHELGLLRPGRHVFRVVDGRGRIEEQSLQVGAEPVDVQLLPSVLSDVDGSYRRTWSTVWSPRPDDLELEHDAVRWLAEADPSVIGGAGLWAAQCALVPAGKGQPAVVQLRVRFPTGMRSAVVHLRAGVSRGPNADRSVLRIEAGFEGALQPWPRAADGSWSGRRAFRADGKSDAFVVRATLRATDPVGTGFAPVRMFDGRVFGGHWRDEPPCFAIVADPDHEAVLPEPAPPPDLSLPSARPGLRLSLPVVTDAVCVLARGAAELLVAGRRDGGVGAVHVVDPDSGACEMLVAASDLRERQDPTDQQHFGTSLALVDDLDADGVAELAIGDPSSWHFGRAHGGSVDVVTSEQRRVLWTWPASDWQSEYGDDVAGHVAGAGDFDGDGDVDLVCTARDAAGEVGQHKAGRIEVRDAGTGQFVWRLRGERAHENLDVVDTLAAAEGGAASLLLRARRQPPGGNQVQWQEWSAWTGGRVGRRTGPLLGAPGSPATLLEASGDTVTLAVLTPPEARPYGRLQRFVWRDEGWHLSAEQELPFGSADGDVAQLLRLPDLDDDGYHDLAAVLDDGGVATLWFVSGERLQPIAQHELEWRAAQVRGCWLPPSLGRPAQLVLVNSGDGGSACTLRGFVPR